MLLCASLGWGWLGCCCGCRSLHLGDWGATYLSYVCVTWVSRHHHHGGGDVVCGGKLGLLPCLAATWFPVAEAIDMSPLLLHSSAAVRGGSQVLRCRHCFCPSYSLPSCNVWAAPLLHHCYCVSWSMGSDTAAGHCICGQSLSLSLPPSCLPYTFCYTHLQMYQCVYLSGMVVYWTEKPLLGYRCLISCKFNGKYIGVFPLHHDADITPILPFWAGTLLSLFLYF